MNEKSKILMGIFPIDVIKMINEYDSTYYNCYRKCIREMNWRWRRTLIISRRADDSLREIGYRVNKIALFLDIQNDEVLTLLFS
jgi:hypothetical protein